MLKPLGCSILYDNGHCELKRPDKDLRRAYAENLSDYKDTVPHLFHFNAFVILGNGEEGRMGSISAEYAHFAEWLKLDERDRRDARLPMEALLKIVCDKRRFMDLFENFILFADGANGLAKIIAKNHQYLGVNRAVEAVKTREDLERKLGVFWHTQGSGKSFSMALFTQKVHRKLGGDFTFLILTDRTDLDNQIYKTFASVGLANNDKDACRASSAKNLRELLGQQKKVIFTMIQKFTDDEAGKAMYVAIDKVTAVRMYNYIQAEWEDQIAALEAELGSIADDQERLQREAKIAWMRETEMAVVVSDEQNEIKKFKDWGLDIIPHRKRMKDGFTVKEKVGGREIEKRLDVETAFKREDHPFRIVIVCAMWLTGFDVPSLSTLYLDKPLQAHTLMQAIARANRVKEGKNNGLIVDYCGILKSLRKALATFAGHTGGGTLGGPDEPGSDVDPVNQEEKLRNELVEAIALVGERLKDGGFDLDRLRKAEGFDKLKALKDAKETINQNDETRKGFEIVARAVFRKYKACLTFGWAEDFKKSYQAINYIYSSLQDDKAEADTTAIESLIFRR